MPPVHTPERHAAPGPQAFAHEPQCKTSLEAATQTPPQSMRPAPHMLGGTQASVPGTELSTPGIEPSPPNGDPSGLSLFVSGETTAEHAGASRHEQTSTIGAR